MLCGSGDRWASRRLSREAQHTCECKGPPMRIPRIPQHLLSVCFISDSLFAVFYVLFSLKKIFVHAFFILPAFLVSLI